MPTHAIQARRIPKAERTRRLILQAAERRFSHAGFTDTRLEDVARDVGVKRAALFYHFRDKRALWDAVNEMAFGGLLARVQSILDGPGGVAERFERAVDAWVDALAARPSMARLLLREAAGLGPEPDPSTVARAEPFLERTRRLLAEGERRGELNPIRSDPFHAISAVVGFTVFYFAALGSLLPGVGFDPHDPKELSAHKRDVRRLAQRLLGIGVVRPVRRRASRP
jgi:TetR/AcrR family transcriptional regulator